MPVTFGCEPLYKVGVVFETTSPNQSAAVSAPVASVTGGFAVLAIILINILVLIVLPVGR